jgi:excisionase family DNA binding protein
VLKSKLFSVRETAKELGRSTDFVRDEINRKRLAHHRLGGRIFVSERDLEAYLNRNRIAALGEAPRR